MPRSIACLMAAMVLAGCGEGGSTGPAASVTVKLPPPRAADARPGFSNLADDTPAAEAEASAS